MAADRTGSAATALSHCLAANDKHRENVTMVVLAQMPLGYPKTNGDVGRILARPNRSQRIVFR
jgi:hypothetical protein